MKESDLKYKVQQKLVDFDNVRSIQPSEEWSQSLLTRLEQSRYSSNARFTSTRFIFAVLLLILINLGFILNSVIRNSDKTLYHNNDLQIISEQLLINPTSLND
jgi:hypothetical protein